MMKTLTIVASAALFAAGTSVPAHAALLDFSLSGSRTATFQLDSNPTPSFSNSSAFGNQIQFSNVSGTFDGTAGIASTIGFGTGPIFAQLNILGTTLGFTQFGGPDLFSGTAAAPNFSPGVFALTSIVSGASTLTITQDPAGTPTPVSDVPEPASVALLASGLLALRMARRRAPTDRV